MPYNMIKKTRTPHFDNTGRLKWDANSPEARYTQQHCKPLHQYATINTANDKMFQQQPINGYPVKPVKSQGYGQPHPVSSRHYRHYGGNPHQNILLENPNGTETLAGVSGCAPSASFETKSELESMYDLIARMLDYDPQTRITLKDALRHPFFDKLAYTHAESLPVDGEISRHILRLQI